MDIGTGYYAEMTRDEAKSYFRRKYTYVEQQVETIQHKLLPEKQKVRQAIVEALQKKIQDSLNQGQIPPGVVGNPTTSWYAVSFVYDFGIVEFYDCLFGMMPYFWSQ